MPQIPAVFEKLDYLTVFEIAESTLVIVRGPHENGRYTGHIVQFRRKQEVSLYVTEPVFPSEGEAVAHTRELIEVARQFAKQERERKD